MVDYRIVGDALRGLSSDIRSITQQDAAHRLGLADIRARQAGQNFQNTLQQGEQNLRIAEADRANYENESITIGQAIDEMKSATPQQKQILKGQIAEFEKQAPGLFSGTFPRKVLWQWYREAAMETQKMMGEAGRHTEKMGLERKGLDIQQQRADTERQLGTERNVLERRKIDLGLSGGAKDNRSTMEKEISAISQIRGIPMQQALDEWQQSKSAAERIRLFNNEMQALNESLDFIGPDGQALKNAKIQELRQLYGIDKISGNQPNIIQNNTTRMIYDPQKGMLVPK